LDGDRSATITVTSDLTFQVGNPDLLVNGVYGNQVLPTNAQSIFNQTILEIDPDLSLELDEIIITMNNTTQTFFNDGSVVKIQGYNGVNWIDLSPIMQYGTTSGTATSISGATGQISFPVTLAQAPYDKYRILGQGGTVRNSYYLQEVHLSVVNFRPEAYPKMACNADTDGDGIYNHLDLDSDGDGCFDAVEAGAVNNLLDSLVIPAGSTAVGDNGLADIIETSTDSDTINFESTYDLFANRNFLVVCADTDMDGIGDLVDIDDDNDGILDASEQSDSCYILGGTDISQLTFTGNAGILLTQTENSIFADATTTSWFSTYSDQTFDLPVHLEFTVDDVAQPAMFGLFPSNASAITTNWNWTGYKHYFPNTSSTDVRVTGSTFANTTYVSGTVYAIDIDVAGNVSFKRDGQEVHTATGAPQVPYKLAISTATSVGRTFENIVIGNVADFYYVCEDIDTDMDGIPDRLDLDSDGDGCFDIAEAGAGFIGDSLVTQNADFDLSLIHI